MIVKKEISLLQYILVINGVQVGTSILSLPAILAKDAGTDGWISIIIGWVITTIISLAVVYLIAKHPGESMLQLLIRYLGTWLGKSVMVFWIVYLLLSAVTILLMSVFIIQEWILPKTPFYFLMILFVVNIYFIMRGGVQLIARYALFVFFFTLWLPLLLLIPLKDSEWIYLLPVLKEGWLPVLYTVRTTILAFVGFELAFHFYPYLKNKQHAAKGIVIANTITLLVYLQITLSCFVYFSPDEITRSLWPTLTLVKPIEFPFLERLEIIFLSFYIFVFLTSIVPYTFFALTNISELFNKRGWQLPYFFLLLLVVLSFFYSPSYAEIMLLKKWMAEVGYLAAYVFPVALFTYVALYTRWRGRETNENAN
ncbi:GerAB/ArcD/ProY family transporter [Aneurinibacillus sp. REN35]|uniref:GerAB/ArcD/ProY family transporter n=1 Tax=Aneurinibacillus sp. REN35 TaxID=3237286 RepID=UPI003527B5FF